MEKDHLSIKKVVKHLIKLIKYLNSGQMFLQIEAKIIPDFDRYYKLGGI